MLKLSIETSSGGGRAGIEEATEFITKLSTGMDDAFWKAVEKLLEQIHTQAMLNLTSQAPNSQGGIERSKELVVSPPEAWLAYGMTGSSPVEYAVIREFGGIVFGNPFLSFQGKYGVFEGEFFTLTEAKHLPHPYFYPAVESEIPRMDEFFYNLFEDELR